MRHRPFPLWLFCLGLCTASLAAAASEDAAADDEDNAWISGPEAPVQNEKVKSSRPPREKNAEKWGVVPLPEAPEAPIEVMGEQTGGMPILGQRQIQILDQEQLAVIADLDS